MANKNKATHSGTCQCCGSFQKLPAGVLSKHGYTTRWGFFDGVCRGAGYQPFEKSTDFIADCIRWAESKVADLEVFQAGLMERPAAGATAAWKHVYRSGNYYRKSGYEWMPVKLTFTVRTSPSGDGFQWLDVAYEHPDTKRAERVARYDLDGDKLDPLVWIYSLNQDRARAVDQEIAKLNEYIRWQQKRVAAWKEEELTAVK